MKNQSIILFFICFFFCLSSPHEVFANDSIPSLFEKALHESRDGDFKNALESWNNVLLSSPNNAIALSNRGNVRLVLGDPEGAIMDQTSALKLLPLEIDPHVNRGIAEEALEQWNEAKSDYKWVLEREPDNSAALYNLGNILGSVQSDWKQAKLFFNKASLVRSDFAIARSSKALACYQLNQIDEAEQDLRSLIRKYPLFADGRAALTALLWRKGSFGEAESHWAAVVGLDGRYREEEWLLKVRRWPPGPINDLMAFLDLETV